MAAHAQKKEEEDKKNRKWLLLLLLLLLLLIIAILVTIWALFFRTKPTLAPDYAPRQNEQYARTSATRATKSWRRQKAAVPSA